MSKLVIVESPSKIKTVKKYLGKDFEVAASTGHVRDLPKSRTGIDIENDFTPKYIPVKGKAEVVRKIKALAKKSEAVYLATDPDREGEAIAWHLANILKLDNNENNRITFNEITKKAVTEGINNPRKINQNLVDAQQARRILDRLVGYELSPFLWKKIKRGLSAGRVQSVATKIIVDREREIEKFVPVEFWNLGAIFEKQKTSFKARFFGDEKGKIEVNNEQESKEILAKLEKAEFVIKSVKESSKQRQPAAPFITSTLQQDASHRYGMTSKNTMRIAQSLYEGVSIKGKGSVGLITYMRTDSLRVSDEARDAAKEYITGNFGENFYPKTPRVFKSKKSAQDAHEAIRPSNIELTPDSISDSLAPEQYKIYKIIWDRFIASQMAASITKTQTAEILASSYIFKASCSSVTFEGYTKVYNEASENDEKPIDNKLPELKAGDIVKLLELTSEQKFTQPPSRFNEASLIKYLEENGIGRPSTYAPTISTIIDRGYVEKEQKQLKPTELGVITTDFMSEHFKDIVNTKFTADMEEKLDEIEQNGNGYVPVLREFYDKFSKDLKTATEKTEGQKIEIPIEVSDVICEKCGANMVVKQSRYGKFLACPNYPDCKNIKNINQDTGAICPKCGGNIILKKSKKGKTFFSCDNYPNCDFITWDVPTKELCPKCGKALFKKNYGKQIGCNAEGCDYLIDVVNKKAKEEK
ncbi:MAG: type I DNA topoisomerase [Clostridia bacterium]